MKKKHNQCYLLLGTITMLLVSFLCSFIFVKGNLERAARKSSFESIYTDTTIDYIVPGPSNSQIDELESTDGNGIKTVTPYYETTATVDVNGKAANGTAILFPFAEKMQYTPYGPSRIASGIAELSGGDAVVDQRYVDRNGCAIGDSVSISIAGQDYTFKIASIAEANTYYTNGTIALILSEDVASQLEDAGLRYSAAYISADYVEACEAYLYSEYKPLSRLKELSEFDNEDVYNQHLQDFNEADWSKEITNCQENYKALSVKYENVQAGIWINILIMTVIVAVVIIVYNTILLTNSGVKSFMRAFLVKKSGTKDAVKGFYRSGIIMNTIVFCIVNIALYIFLTLQVHISPLDHLQVLNCIIPILTAIIVAVVMIGVSSAYVDKHYKVRVIKKKDSTEEVQVEVI